MPDPIVLGWGEMTELMLTNIAEDRAITTSRLL